RSTWFRSSPRWASKTLPFHASRWASLAAVSVRAVPGAISTVPSAFPFGMSPAGLARNRSSSSRCDIASRAGTSTGASAIAGRALHGRPGLEPVLELAQRGPEGRVVALEDVDEAGALDPVDPGLRVGRGRVVVREEAVAVDPPGGHQDEDP